MKIEKIFDAFPPPRFLDIPYVGISISDSFVRCMKFSRKNGKFLVSKYLEKSIPVGVVNSGQINNKEELINILDSVKKEIKVTDVKVAIGEENAYLFTAKLPIISKEEIVSAIESKMEENVPVPPAELTFDYKVLNHKKKEHLDIVVYAVPTKTVDSYVEVLNSAGLRPVSLEIESQAISRALLSPVDTDTVLIVNFSLNKAGLYVVYKGIARFSSTITIKGDPVQNPSILLQEIKKLYMYWHTLKENLDEPTRKIEKIIICGEDVDESVIPYLSSNLDTKISLGNVWTNAFDINKEVPDVPYIESLKYASAVGLALSLDISI